MNSKMTTNSQLSTNEPIRKEKQRKHKLSEQVEQEQNQKQRSHGGISVGRGEMEGEWGEKVQGTRSIIGRHKIDVQRSKLVQETEDSKNLYVQPMDMN